MTRVRDVPRARAVVLSLGLLLGLAFPAAASATQSISVTSPTGFPAGGDPTFTTTTTLDTSAGTPSLVTVRLAPGVLSSLNANPSCVTGAPQYTSACQVGEGSAALSVGSSFSFSAYLAPPPSAGDAAGIDLVTGSPQAVTHAGVQLTQTPAGNVQAVLRVDLSQLGDDAAFVTGITLTLNGTLDGKPFNRMPTNCGPGSTTLTVVYANATETTAASPDVTPTGCSSLPYAPVLAGTAVKDRHDNGVAVSIVIRQAADGAASSATTLRLPWPTLSANAASISLLGTSTPVGTATLLTPLLPQALPGIVYLTGLPLSPTLTIRFPAPAAMTLIGSLDENAHTVTFRALPDLPQTSLTVTLHGGSKAILNASCAHPSGTLGGAFTDQAGTVVRDSRTLTVAGCAAGPRVSESSLSGLAAGKPRLRLKLAGDRLHSFTISLPSGLSFNRGALRRGVFVSRPYTLHLSGGRLRVTLRRPSRTVSVTVRPPALRAASGLRRRTRHLTFRLALADTGGPTTVRTISL